MKTLTSLLLLTLLLTMPFTASALACATFVLENGTLQVFGRNYVVPIRKWPIYPISVLRSKFYPRNINYMPAVKLFTRLDLDQIFLFLDGHYVGMHVLILDKTGDRATIEF